MDWIVRNTSFLAFFLVLVAVAGELLRLLFVLGSVGSSSPSTFLGELMGVALSFVAIAVGYGLLVRFLGLCDDIAALRRAQTGNPSSLD